MGSGEYNFHNSLTRIDGRMFKLITELVIELVGGTVRSTGSDEAERQSDDSLTFGLYNGAEVHVLPLYNTLLRVNHSVISCS
jgi:hypothetical protein